MKETMPNKSLTTTQLADRRKSSGKSKARPPAHAKLAEEKAKDDMPLCGATSSLMLLLPDLSDSDFSHKSGEKFQRNWKAKRLLKKLDEKSQLVNRQESRSYKGKKSVVPVGHAIRRALLEESYEEDAEDLPKVEPVPAPVLDERCLEILTSKKLISKRMGRIIGRWATHNYYKVDENFCDVSDDKSSRKKKGKRADVAKRQSSTCLVASDTGHFPTGLGFYLCPEECFSFDNEPQLHRLYDTIMLLDDQQTQDYLLSFLHDFTLKRSVFGSIQHQRYELLKQVKKWIHSSFGGTVDAGIEFEKAFSKVSEAEIAFGEPVQRFTAGLWRLTFLHKIMRYSSIVTAETELALEQESFTSQQGTPTEDETSMRSKLAIAELFRAIKERLQQKNKLMMNCLGVTLKSAAQTMIDLQKNSTTVQQSVEKTRAAILQINKTTTDLAVSKQKLTEKLQQLEKEAAAKDISRQKKAFTLTDAKSMQPKKIKVDAASQTTEPSKGGKRVRKLRQKSEDTISYDSSKSGKSEQSKSSRGSRKAVKSPEAKKPASKQLGSKKKTKKGKVMFGVPGKSFKEEEKPMEEKPQEMIPEENPEVLVKMLRRFNIVSMKCVHRLRLTLEDLKQKAETDADTTLERECKVRTLIEKMRPVQGSVDKQVANYFPLFSMGKQALKMQNRPPTDHKCRLCFCHQRPPKNEVTLASWQGGKTSLVENLLSHCQTYVKLLDSVKARYQDISRRLSAALELLAPHKRTFPFRRGQTGVNETTDTAREWQDLEMAEALLEVEVFPDASLEDSLPRAAKVSTLLGDLIWRSFEVLRDTRVCLTDMQDQKRKLDQVELELNKAEELLQTSGLQVAQKRAGTDFLQTGKLLRDCLCAHCRCYNSPFDDKQRDFSTLGSVSEQLQHSLSWAVSLVKQGLRAPQFRLQEDAQQSMESLNIILGQDSPHRRSTVVGVTPEIMSLLAKSTAMMSGAIDFVGGPVPLSPSDSLCTLARLSISGLFMPAIKTTPSIRTTPSIKTTPMSSWSSLDSTMAALPEQELTNPNQPEEGKD